MSWRDWHDPYEYYGYRYHPTTKKLEIDSGLDIKSLDEAVEIQVPLKLLEVFMWLDQNSPYPDDEWGLLLKADLTEIPVVKILEEYYLPEQEVSGSQTKFTKPQELTGWNAVIHRHPMSLSTFSSTDYEYLTRNFDVSLLWQGNKVQRGTVKLKLGSEWIYVETTNVRLVSNTELNLDLSKIKKEITSYYSGKYGASSRYAPDKTADVLANSDTYIENIATYITNFSQPEWAVGDLMLKGEPEKTIRKALKALGYNKKKIKKILEKAKKDYMI